MCSALQKTTSWDALPQITEDLYLSPSDHGFNRSPIANNLQMTPNASTNPPKQEQHDDGFQSMDSSSPLSNSTSSPESSHNSTLFTTKNPIENRDALKKKLQRDTRAPRTCVICASPASCYHYQAPSCNGCKTFFRRSIVLRKNYACKFDSRCAISAGARCRSCRFDQCLINGMDPSVIKFVDRETAAAVLSEVNKRKRQLSCFESCSSSCATSGDDSSLAVQAKLTPRFDQTADSRVVDFLTYMELKLCRLRESLFDDHLYYGMKIGELLKGRSELGNADKYERPKNWPLSPSKLRLNEDFFRSETRHWLAFDVLLNVEYLKAMPFYHQLDVEDREALAIHVVLVNTVLVQSWYSYKANSRTVMHPDGLSPLNMRALFPVAKIYPDIIPIELDSFVRNIDPLFRVAPDPEEYCLLKAIIFCHSDAPGLSQHAQALLQKERQIYAATLLRRMQARLGSAAGAGKFAEILSLIETFFHFGQKKREFHVFISTIRCKNDERMPRDPPILEWFLRNSSKFD